MKSEQRTNLHQELESLLRSVMPTGDVVYRAAEIAFALAQMNGRFIECEYGFVGFLKHLECSPELRSDLMRDLVPLWGKISNLQEKYSEKECETAIRECARQDAPNGVNVPPSLVPLVTKLLSSKAGGIMVDIGCGDGLVLAQALEEDADLHGEGIDINQRNANFSEMVISSLKPRGDVCCKSVFDFLVDRIGKYDKVFCFPPIGIRVDRNWEDFQLMLPGDLPHVGTGCSSELVFALTTIAAMKDTGLAVVILPEKALCGQKNGAIVVREYLLNSGYLECVIRLPERMLGQIQIGMSLLIFSKKAGRAHVSMIDASGLGKKGCRCDVFLVEDVEKIIKAAYGFRNDDEWMSRYSKIVSCDEIRGSGYNFSVQHYIKAATICTKPDSRGNRPPVSVLVGAISGYALVDKILNYYGNEGVARLLKCANHRETEFLELKTSYLLSEEDKKDGERQENLNWDIALALIAIANTAGGALIIGVGNDNRTLHPIEVKGDEEAFLRMNICQVLLPDQRAWTVCKKNGKGKDGKPIYVKEKWMADGLPRYEARLYPYSDGENSGNVVLILVEPQPRGRYITLEDINLGTKMLVHRKKGIGKVVSYYDSAKFRELDNERDIERSRYLRLLLKFVPDFNATPIGRSSGVYRFKPADGYDGKDIEDPLVRQTEGHRLCCDFKPGDQIDKYSVEERIGSGGMGVVYRVRHLTLGGEYALKAFKMESEDSSMAKERFRAEAQVLRQLSHPGLPEVYDLGFDERAECYYLVQDLIVGWDGKPHELGGYVVNPKEADAHGLARISNETALKWLRQVCEIANYLHGKGIAHRDITLKNLLIDIDGNVKLTDFGIAKVMSQELREMINCQVTMTFTQTPSGDKGFLGTLRYLPPEVQEKRKSDITPEATDVWAIGVSFFKVLTGEWFGSQQFADYDWNDGTWGNLLRGMLKVDSKKRMSCAEVLKLLDSDSKREGAYAKGIIPLVDEPDEECFRQRYVNSTNWREVEQRHDQMNERRVSHGENTLSQLNSDNLDVKNKVPRCPVMLLLDTSGSMAGQPINELNAALHQFIHATQTDEATSLSVELAIITFGSTVKVAQAFTPIVSVTHLPVCSANGPTPTGRALLLAGNALKARLDLYRANGIRYCRPWIVLLTDGCPTDNWRLVATRFRAEAERRKYMCVGVEIGEACDDNTLLSILPATPGPIKLKGLCFSQFFNWLTDSLKVVCASAVPEQDDIALPLVTAWAED